MTGITDIGTTYNLPNFHGELVNISPTQTPLLTAIGGLQPTDVGKKTTSTKFEWQEQDLRDPSQPAVLEGADAPPPEERVRDNVENVVQIHHEAVAVSYSKLAATGQYASTGADGAPNPVTNELDKQTVNALTSIALDVNWSFINGKLHVPDNNAEARRTRGLIEAIQTNVINKGAALSGAATATDTITVTHALDNGDPVIFTDVGAATGVQIARVYYVVNKTTVSFKVAATPGGSPITLGTATVSLIAPADTELDSDVVGDLAQKVYDSGGVGGETATFLVSSTQKRALTKAFADAFGKANAFGDSRTVGGLSLETVITDVGTFNILLDRHVPRDVIIATTLDQLTPVFLETPGKGVFFEEPLAKTGSAERVQLYGEIGLAWGNERAHGILRGLKV